MPIRISNRWQRSLPGAALLATLAACSQSQPDGATERIAATRQAAVTSSAPLPPAPCANAAVLGFESLGEWTASSGSLSLSAVHTQGASSLAVAGPVNYTTITSVAITSSDAELAALAVGSSLELDLALPTRQPNPFWFGTLQLFVSAPSRGLNNQPLGGTVSLTGTPLGAFQTVTFAVPNAVAAALAGQTYADLRFTLALNVPSAGTGVYLFDDLRVKGTGGAASNVHPELLCVNKKSAGVFEARFGYDNENDDVTTIPVGANNQVTPGPAGQGQVEDFLPTHVPNAFALLFDGGAIAWDLAGGCAAASAQSPACPATGCTPACPQGAQCVGGACVTECGDGLCAGNENCTTCPADCTCAAGQVCVRDTCAKPATCGADWQCGAGVSFGVNVDCGACPAGATCINHVCQ